LSSFAGKNAELCLKTRAIGWRLVDSRAAAAAESSSLAVARFRCPVSAVAKCAASEWREFNFFASDGVL
jgi:hypothetical protein